MQIKNGLVTGNLKVLGDLYAPEATADQAGLLGAADKDKLDKLNVAYGTCDTAAATAAKVVTIDDANWQLQVGSIIVVKFTNSNSASSVTLNVNETGAKSIYYNNAVYTSTSTNIAGYANRHITYMYNGTNWVWLGSGVENDTNTYQRVYPTTADIEYPITTRYNTTTGSSYYTEYGRYSTGVTLNPSTNTITASNIVLDADSPGDDLGGGMYSYSAARGDQVKAYVQTQLTYGTEDLTAGTSELATGVLYFVYE